MNRPIVGRVRKIWWPVVVTFWVTVAGWGYVLFSDGADQAFGWGGKGRFFDLRGSVAAGEVASTGGDAYAINPRDPSGRPHLYSSWWLVIGKLGVTQRDVDWLGEALAMSTLLVALCVWWPADGREAAIAIATLSSPAWWLAIYRGNNDLVIFLLLALAIYGMQRSSLKIRLAAAAGIGALAVLKYFPGAAILAAWRARSRRELLAGGAAFTAVVAIGYPSLLPAFAAVGKYAPETGGLHSFGVTILVDALSRYFPGGIAWLIGGAAAAIGFGLGRLTKAPSDSEGEQRTLAAVVGGVVTVGCFVIGASFTYKFVFLWWTLPWLLRDAPTLVGRRHAVFLVILLLVSFWADGVVAMVVNGLGPAWTHAARARALPFIHGAIVATQLGYWLVVGVFLRVATDWTRQQISRLSSMA